VIGLVALGLVALIAVVAIVAVLTQADRHSNQTSRLLAHIASQHATWARERWYESTWFLNLAFNQGEQWVAHDGRGLYHPRTRKGQVRLTDNRVRPIVRSEVARLSKERPGWAATPDGLGDDAVNSALTATRLLEYAYDHLNFQPRRREAITWSRICGAGFIKTCWDPTRGEGAEVLVYPQEVAVPAPDPSAEPIMAPHPQAGQAVLHPVTQRVLKPGDLPEIESTLETKTVGGGDVSLAVRSPFDIFPDPLATSLDDARWIIDEAVRSPEYVKEHYGVEVKPDAPTMVGIVESGFHGAAVEGEGDQVGVKVYELWEPRSKGNPQGRRLVFTQQKVLYEGPNEYKRIPYTMFPGIIVPGRFWPDAVVTDLRPIQARWNKLLSQFAENLSKFGNPAMLIDALAQVKYTGVPGEKIKANFGGPVPPVQYLNPPSVPGYAFNFAQIVEGAFQEIAGHSETASGAVPPGSPRPRRSRCCRSRARRSSARTSRRPRARSATSARPSSSSWPATTAPSGSRSSSGLTASSTTTRSRRRPASRCRASRSSRTAPCRAAWPPGRRRSATSSTCSCSTACRCRRARSPRR
jgi:hypothetical protein